MLGTDFIVNEFRKLCGLYCTCSSWRLLTTVTRSFAMVSKYSTFCTWIVCIIWGLTLVSVKSTPSVDISPKSYSETLVFGSVANTSLITVYLTCQVDNIGHGQKVAWFKNYRQISENSTLLHSDLIDPQRYSIVGNPKLNLYIVLFSYLHAFQDSGRYQCRVLNADGSLVVASNEAEVTINVIPRDQYPMCNQFEDGREYQGNRSEYFNGDNVTLQCLSDPGNPGVVFMWFRNDTVTPLITKAYTYTDFYQSLNFTVDLSTEEAGTKFICQLTQVTQTGPMNRNCTIGPITIYDEPIISIYPEDSQVNSTNEVVPFTCNVETSHPSIKNYNWNVENIANSSELTLFQVEYMYGNKTITLSRFQSVDNGKYNIKCIVDYGFTFRKTSARLQVSIPSLLPSTTETRSTIATFTSEMTVAQVSHHTRIDQYSSEQINTRDIKTTIVHDQQSEEHSKTETVVGAIFGVLMLISLVLVIAIVFIRKRHNRKQEDEREMATQGDYANLTVDQREDIPSDINACPRQVTDNIHEMDKGRIGEDRYANLTVDGPDGRDRSSDSVYTQLSPSNNDSITPMQRMVGEDGYALVNLGRIEDNVTSEYAHLSSLTDESSVTKRELVGDDGYANLTGRSEGDSDPAYAQLTNVDEDSKKHNKHERTKRR